MATNKTIQRPKKISLIIMHFRKKGNLAMQEDLSGSTYYSEDTVIKIISQLHSSRCFESLDGR